MIRYVARTSLDFVFGSRGLNSLVEDEMEERGVEEARKSLQGQRSFMELETVTSKEGRNLVRRSWSPPEGKRRLGLVYICHGFTEHMANYSAVGEFLSDAGFHCFGTDLVGHGLSDPVNGLKAFIPDFEACRQDILEHIKDMRQKHGLDLPVFAVAHSMGGMLTIRLTLDHPNLFEGIVLVGPLIQFGSSNVLRNFPTESIWPIINGTFQWIMKHVNSLSLAERLDSIQIGLTDVDNITSDIYMRRLLTSDNLRHFGGAYLGMLSKFSAEIARNLRDLPDKMTTPFCILFGQNDPLCNVRGGWQMYLQCHRVRKADKAMIEFEHAAHQLYLEIPAVREKAMKETLQFLLSRLP